MKKVFLTLALFLTPMLALAQQQTLQEFIKNFVLFLNNIIVPFLLGIAFLIFVINAMRFFVFQSANEDGQKNAKALATYSILAFVFVLIFWGIVNMLASSFTGCNTLNQEFDAEFGGPCNEQPTSDYIELSQPTGATGSRGATSPRGQQSAPGTASQPTNPAVPTQTFTPPSNEPIQPPPISDGLEGAPDPFADPSLQGGPGQVDIRGL